MKHEVKLSVAIDRLREMNIDVRRCQEVNKGINSRVFKLTTCRNINYALKFYRVKQENDKRDRYSAEIEFMDYINKAGVDTIPDLIYKDSKNQWTLMEWIEGISKDKLDEYDINKITEFIIKINMDKNSGEREGLRLASEACVSLEELTNNVERRAESIERLFSDKEGDFEKWVKEKVVAKAKDTARKTYKENYGKKCWKGVRKELIASPSDVGLHNIIFQKEKLYFIDFEYAGLDDISKLACDWILQPEYQLNPKKEKILIERLSQLSKYDDNGVKWKERYGDIKNLIHKKWCLIMLNGLDREKECVAKKEKIKQYYSSFKY